MNSVDSNLTVFNSFEQDDLSSNIFVTQYAERDNEVLGAHIVKDTPTTLLETGLNTFQETLVVSKEKELINTNEKLYQKRYDFEKIMKKHNKKRQELIKSQEIFFNQIQGFNSFIEDNNAKTRRAMVKYQSEIRLIELQTNIESEIKKEMENTKLLHEKLLKKVKRNKIYEDFLIQAVECLPSDYIKMTDNILGGLLMRYNTLQSTNESLFSEMISKSGEASKYIKFFATMKQDHENQILNSNYKLSLLYETHEKLQDEIERSEQTFRIKHGNLREEMLEFGLTLRAIDNITRKCSAKFDPSLADSDLESKICKIQDYIITTRQIIDTVKEMKDDKRIIQLPEIPTKIVLTSEIEAKRPLLIKIRNISSKS